MLINKFKGNAMSASKQEMITYLNQLHQSSYAEIDTNSDKYQGLKSFTEAIYASISANPTLPIEVTLSNSQLFSRYSYNLMLYRACLANAHEEQTKFNENYLGYVNENNIYSRTLANGNPFLLKRHFSKLMELVDNTQDAPLTPANFKLLSEAIQKFSTQISALSPDHYAGFKAMMAGYNDVLLAKLMDYNLAESKRVERIIKKLLDKTSEAFQLAKDLQTEKIDSSIKLYGDAHLPPALPYASPDDALLKVNDLKQTVDESHDSSTPTGPSR